MRLSQSLIAVLAPVAAACALTSAPAAHAQSRGMDCFGIQGGRAICVESRDALFDRLDQTARETQVAANREKRLVRKVAEAIHEGRCADALVLALRSSNPQVPANTARLCGVPEAEIGTTTPKS